MKMLEKLVTDFIKEKSSPVQVTSVQEVAESKIRCLRSMRETLETMQQERPNIRDFRTSEDWRWAKKEHDSRIQVISDLIEEIQEELENIVA